LFCSISVIRLIHIAPQLPPTVGGVADYTAILSQRLVEVSDGAIEPVLVNAGWKESPPPEVEFPTVDISGRADAKTLTGTIRRLAQEASGDAAVLLEYSGYGFAKRGAPWWLVQGLQRVCSEQPGISIITMFHELYATGPPWTSAFWLSPAQRYVAAELARFSDAVVTNRTSSAQWLQSRVGDAMPVTMQPVFSNVGEPEAVSPYGDRKAKAIMFGGARRKSKVYRNHWADLEALCKRLDISDILDVGGAVQGEAKRQRVRRLGHLPSEEVARCFHEARVGFLWRGLDALTKSGVMAAYMAFGVVPVIIRNDTSHCPMLTPGDHFFTLETVNGTVPSLSTLSRVSDQAKDWYYTYAHSRRTAQRVLHLIQSARHPPASLSHEAA
jgi:hypothetical protein